MQRLEEASGWTDHTYEVLIALSALETQVVDAETGQRGFLLTGDARYLEPYGRASGQLKRSLEDLRTLTADNPVQQRKLDHLVKLANERIAVLGRALDLYRQRGLETAIAAIKTNEGKILMDKIRAVLDDMDNEERRLLVMRRAEEQVSRRNSNLVIILSAAATLVFLAIATLLIRDDLAVRAQLRQTVERMALQDALTGLPNRAAFDDRLKAALASATRNQRKLAVLYFDLDGFKAINDRFGHSAGDQLLHKIAERAKASLRASDYLARLGGDEFVVLLDEIARDNTAGVAARKIIHAVSQPVVFESGGEGRVSASVGISLFPVDGVRPERLVQLADEAMYRAKQAGKARFAYHAQPGIGDEPA